MRRVAILGCGGAGKSTLARAIVLRRIESVADGRRIEILRDPRDVARYLETL